MTLEEKKIEEVFDKYSHKDNGGEYMYYSHFLKAVTSICQQEIDEACKKQREAIANEFGVDCPDCDNCGYTIQADFNGEPCQVQCEFCYTEKHSKFNYLSAPSPKESE